MCAMPKKIDPEVRARAVRLVIDHLSEYPSLTAAVEAVARRVGVGKESVRRWVVQAQIDGGHRRGATGEEFAEVKALKARVRQLESDNAVFRAATVFFAGELDPRNR
jgi:transposase